MALAEIAAAVEGVMRGGDVPVSGVSTDTRTLSRGDLFVAIGGPNFDGHEFVGDARARHAAAALLDRFVDVELPMVKVADTQDALGRLGAHWRRRFPVPLIGVTGSNGKTTVKNMVAAILGQSREVLSTRGNLNNHIGVPLTLCRLRASHQVAVVEMGMNHPGEISVLSRMAKPDVVVITNAAAAHLEGLGDVAAVARAKGEIFDGLDEQGTAVINADDPHAAYWRRRAGSRRVVDFSLEGPAAVAARWRPAAQGSELDLDLEGHRLKVFLPLLGRHNAANALAASAAAMAAGASPEMIRSGLAAACPAAGRLNPMAGRNGSQILDDSYNANPDSVRAAIEVLAGYPGERILVLGDMAELGAAAETFHEQIGRLARQAGVDRLMGCGPLATLAAQSFGPGGSHAGKQALIDELLPRLAPGVTVLLKGSRSMHMETLVDALRQPDGEEPA